MTAIPATSSMACATANSMTALPLYRPRCGSAVVTGDMIHLAIQACEPDICSTFCFDEEQARTTRRDFLTRCSDTGVLVLGTHFCDPTGIHIRPDGDGWRFETAETDTR
jgi:hypothetical protein